MDKLIKLKVDKYARMEKIRLAELEELRSKAKNFKARENPFKN